MHAGSSPLKDRFAFGVCAALLALAALVLPGCPGTVPDPGGTVLFNNTTDPTNNNASYFGSGACGACHQDVIARHRIHAHAVALQEVDGQAPTYPPQGTRAGVPNPPAGSAWAELAYVIGGYMRAAQFVDQQGFVMTNDADGVDTKWKLAFDPIGTTTGFIPYENQGNFSPANPQPYAYSCFKCHTTGGSEQDPNNPQFQENLPGIPGTWQEEGVQCEACHGPGSNHVANTSARDLYVNVQASACGLCHTRAVSGTVIQASGGYLEHNQQWPELRASGGHAGFQCTTCHNPHASPNYDRDNAIRNPCTACHNQNLALHQGRTYVRGDYWETITCESCHMPLASKSAAVGAAAVVGPVGRAADIHTHIFRVNTQGVNYINMLSGDLSQVAKDGQGRAAVTLDFVCLRCHNGLGNAFALTLGAASPIAESIHD